MTISENSSKIQLKQLTPESSKEDTDRLYQIMLHAYAITEERIWGEEYIRMSRSEFNDLIANGEVVAAWKDNVPVGSIQVSRVDEHTFSFGLLSVDFDYKGLNIGRMLIERAEQIALDCGASYMSLEILRPENEVLPVKQVLSDWYIRQGYMYTESVGFLDKKPDKLEKSKLFVQPSVFDCYRKRLDSVEK